MEDHSVIEDLKKAKEVLERELYRGENNNKKLNDEINIKLKLIKEKENEIQAQYKQIEQKQKGIIVLEKEKEKYGI